MFAQMTQALDFQAKALVLRADRQRIIASNIANADTPGYAARELNFKDALAAATGPNGAGVSSPRATSASMPADASHPRHLPLQPRTSSLSDRSLDYAPTAQPAMDNNSVDMDRERAAFVDNAVRYEATLRFINGQAKTILSAIQGQ
ncbi:MAG: flagellar basal body rod protein FlgB [Rhodoferax sp.]